MGSSRQFLYLLTTITLLSSTSARSADAQTPLLSVDRYFRHPRLTWPNATGETYELLTSQEVDNRDWNRWLTISTESKITTWSDETGGTVRFYRVRASAETNWALKLQIALDRSRKTTGAKGVSAVVITSNGVWQGTSGNSTTRPTNCVVPQMRFSIGSISKTFTTALIMQLAEEGTLSLDDPLSRWLPDYKNITNAITIRQLLSHTSGVYNFTENPNYGPMVMSNKVYAHTDALALVGSRDFLPGKGYHYSNTGFILLGLVAESATHDTVAHQFRTRFLEPLHLTSTYLEGAEEASGERAHGFTVSYTGLVQDAQTNSIWQVEYPVAWTAGAMTSTAYDLANWMRALYGGEVVSAASLAAMTKWSTLSGLSYGLGTARVNTSKGEFCGHSGGITGYLSLAAHCPARGATVVVLVNQDNVDPGVIWSALVTNL